MKTDSTPIRQWGERSTGVNDSSFPTKSRFITGLSRLRVEWSDENRRATDMGGLAYFVEYLQATGLFECFVRECPLSYESNNAPAKLDILGVVVLSVLRGHTRYAHMSALCGSELDRFPATGDE